MIVERIESFIPSEYSVCHGRDAISSRVFEAVFLSLTLMTQIDEQF